MLIDKIQQDQITALKSREEKKLSVLRFLLSDIKNEQINKQKDLTDEDVVSIIRKQVKKLEDAAAMFEKGGRPELATDNREQIAILKTYLPAELSDEDLKARIETIIAENQSIYDTNPKAIIGPVMKELGGQASPQRILAILQTK